jgi:5-methylcytosine-specific restriction endonuclease McrA
MTMEKRPNPPFPNYATFEHLIPQALGGSGRVENLRLACYDCNQIRGKELADQLKRERAECS